MSPVLLTGPRWQGRPGAHRRARLRRAASASLLGIGVLVAGRAVEDEIAPRTETVLVAAHDLAAGATLAAGDLASVERPRGSGPAPAHADPNKALGGVLATPVRAGEEITPSRLVGPDLLAGQPPGTRAIWLPAASSDALTAIAPGARVDVHVRGVTGAVLRGVVVLALSGGRGVSGGLIGADDAGGAGLLVAAPGVNAARVLGLDPGEIGMFRFALSGR